MRQTPSLLCLLSPQGRGEQGHTAAPAPTQAASATARASFDRFLISFLILFLELACIRWFGAHVLFLTFFTNCVLLACFLGMSLGCLAARRARNYLSWTPPLLALAMAASLGLEAWHAEVERLIDVGEQASPAKSRSFHRPSSRGRGVGGQGSATKSEPRP
ncbi:MAG: hypothetical protein L0Y72_07695 [Gemmataceae bacterium]|nr:hypothetical protein [Gemmataceae bacterium]MCI0738912.1 hypothetical protein [Gemmataceae bacterium]